MIGNFETNGQGSFLLIGKGSQGDICQKVDREVKMLSSRKLWDIIRLSDIEGCAVDAIFLEEVRAELLGRGESIDDNPWNLPH